MSATKSNHVKLGIFVVAGVSLGIATLMWIGAGSFNREVQPFVTYFDESVQGLDVGSPVKIRGVTIGEVRDIRIAPDRKNVEVQSDVYVDALVRLGLQDADEERGGDSLAPPEVRIQLATAGITGVKFLQVDFFDPVEHPYPVYDFPPPPNYVPSVSSTLKNIEEHFTEAMTRLPGAIDQIDQLAAGVAQVVRDLDVAGISSRLQLVLDTVEEKIEGVDTVELTARVEGTLTRIDETAVAFQRAGQSVEDVTARIAEAIERAEIEETSESIRQAAVAYRELAADGHDVSDELLNDLVAVREALEALRALADLIERDPGILLRGRTEGGGQ